MQNNNREISIIKGRLLEYLEDKGISKYECYQNTGITNGVFSQKSGISEDNILRFLSYYTDINTEWLFTGQGKMLKSEKKYTGNYTGNYTGIEKNEEITPVIKQPNEAKTISLFGAASRTIDIPIVEISAAAGYGSVNPDHAEHIGVIRLPMTMVKQGTHYCIRIKGESMSPTLQDSDYLIIRRIEPQDWLSMPDEHVFVVVDRDGMAYVKRVKNRLKKGFIVLMSDNIDKSQYKNFNLQGDEIYNIFHAEWHFSAKMQNINDSYYNRLKSLEDTVTEQGDILKKVLQSIEKK